MQCFLQSSACLRRRLTRLKRVGPALDQPKPGTDQPKPGMDPVRNLPMLLEFKVGPGKPGSFARFFFRSSFCLSKSHLVSLGLTSVSVKSQLESIGVATKSQLSHLNHHFFCLVRLDWVNELAARVNSPSWSLAIPFEMSKITVRNACALFFFAGRSMFAFQREPIFAQIRKEYRGFFQCQFEHLQAQEKSRIGNPIRLSALR
jgi:hypothetical protein